MKRAYSFLHESKSETPKDSTRFAGDDEDTTTAPTPVSRSFAGATAKRSKKRGKGQVRAMRRSLPKLNAQARILKSRIASFMSSQDYRSYEEARAGDQPPEEAPAQKATSTEEHESNPEEVAAATEWDDIYDPSKPTDYEQYMHSDERDAETREWKDRLYAHRLARRGHRGARGCSDS